MLYTYITCNVRSSSSKHETGGGGETQNIFLGWINIRVYSSEPLLLERFRLRIKNILKIYWNRVGSDK